MAFLDFVGKATAPMFGDMMGSFLHPEDAYKAAQEQAERGYQRAEQYEKPYFQQGQDQYSRLQEAIQQLMNPEGLTNRFADSYETSPYAKRMLEMNRGSGLDAASSMGIMGSSAALSNIQQGAGNIVGKERQQYIQQLMENYLKGIGLSHDIYNTGSQAAGNLANYGMQHGENMAGLKYGESRAPGQLFENLLKLAGNAYSGGMGGSGGAGGSNGFLS